MKILKSLAVILLAVFFITACNDTSNPITPNMPKPLAPSNLQATTYDSSTIAIMWDKSPSDDSTWFKGYSVIITGGGPMSPVFVPQGAIGYTAKNLVEGTIYTFTVRAVNKDTVESDASISVQWSPATRFVKNNNDDTIKIYEYDSQYGSGLEFFNADGKPENKKAAEKASWNVGIDTRSGKLIFGSASQLSFGTGTPTKKTEISNQIWNTNSLDFIFDSKALSDTVNHFSDATIDLLNDTGLNPSTGVAFIMRIIDGTTVNFAKALIRRNSDGTFLFGDSPNRYIVMDISYQRVPGVPYAK